MIERLAGLRHQRWTLIGVAVGAVAAVALAVLAVSEVGEDLVATLPTKVWGGVARNPSAVVRAESTVQEAGVAVRDAQKFWKRVLRAETGRDYEPMAMVYFWDLTPSPCAGALYAAGPFYCEVTQTASIDLAFMDEISEGLMHEGDLGSALFLARIVAAHVQGQLGALEEWRRAMRGASWSDRQALELALALEADCLTGVWAGQTAEWIASAPPELYGRTIDHARDIAAARPYGAALPDDALLGPGSRGQRAAAFRRGRDGGSIAVCRG